MTTDAYGLPLTTGSPAAVPAYDRAVHGLLGWDGAALEMFQAATAHDPQLAVAHAGIGVCLFLEERFAEARAAATAAREHVAGASVRERGHVEALALLVTGKVAEAETAMREHLGAWPRDLVIAQRLYFVWFWQGRFPEILDLTTELMRRVGRGPFLPGLHAFALEQADRCAEAAALAETVVARDPRDAWAVHALAHALFEQAAFDTGVETLPARIHPCTHLGWFRNHLLWHLALMHLGRGEYDRVSALSRSVFERQPSSIAGDLHDSISLLWRLLLAGQDVRERWSPFVAIARERLDRQGLLFHVVHLAMALAGGGDWRTAEQQVDMLRARVAKDRTGLIAELALPLIAGIHAFARAEYAEAIRAIEPLTPRIVALGGSRAQRDVFHDTLLEACFRAGDMDRAERLLAARVARRPDHHWATRKTRPAVP
jgi:hypothetical protein